MRCNQRPSLENDSLQTRQSLLSRLKNWDDSESWSDFFRTYWKLIFNTARKAGLTEEESQEVVQQTVIEVSKRIAEFKYDPKRGSFKTWLLQMTRWRINDQFRHRLPLATAGNSSLDDDGTNLLNQIPDPAGSLLEQAWDAEWEKNLFEAAVERVKQKVSPRIYQIFDSVVFQEWPLEKVRDLLNVNTGQIRMAKFRVSKLIKNEMKYLEKRLV